MLTYEDMNRLFDEGLVYRHGMERWVRLQSLPATLMPSPHRVVVVRGKPFVEELIQPTVYPFVLGQGEVAELENLARAWDVFTRVQFDLVREGLFGKRDPFRWLAEEVVPMDQWDLALRDPGCHSSPVAPFVRLDMVKTESGFMVVDINLTRPAGIGHYTLLNKVSASGWGFETERVFSETMYRCFDEWCVINNRSESARIGILVDWDAGDWHDFRLIGEILGGQDWVECVGLIAEAPDPSDERFNCIMRSRIKVGHPEFPKLVAMPRERFCVVSPLGRRFIGNKFWMVAFRLPELRLIFKERLGSYYSVLDSVIPRTGVLRRGSVLFPDEEMGVELLNRKEWILKPPAGSSGRGIVIGRSTSQKKWIEICYSSGANGAVIQEYFRVKEDVDVLGKSGVPTKIRAYTKYGAFLYGGQVAACEVNVRCQPLVHGTRDTYLSFTLWGDLEKSDR